MGYVAFRPTILSFARRPTLLVVAKSPPCGGTRRFRRFRFFLFEVSKPIGMVNALQLMRCSPAGFLPSTVSDQNRNEAALIHCRLLGASMATWPGASGHWNLETCWCVLKGINIHGAIQRTYEAKLWIQKRLGRQSYPYHPCMVYLPRFAMKFIPWMLVIFCQPHGWYGLWFIYFILISSFICTVIVNMQRTPDQYIFQDPILSGCRNRYGIISWKARSFSKRQKWDL